MTLLTIVQRTNSILYCDKWTETVAFYRDVLRFPVTHRNDWFVEFYLAAGMYLSIADASRTSMTAVAGQGITLSWQVADIQAHHQALQQQGIAVTDIKAKKKWQARLFYFYDPEGHRIELWQPLVDEAPER